MTLKLRLAAMMIFLLMAVLALQYVLVQREEQALMNRLSDLSLGVDESTREFSRRAHELALRPLPREHLVETLFADSAASGSTRVFITKVDSTRTFNVEDKDVVMIPGIPDSVRALIDQLGPPRHPGADSLSQMTLEVVMDVSDSNGSRTVRRVQTWSPDRADMMRINLPVPSQSGDALWTVRMGVPMGGFRDELNRARRRSFFWLAGLLGVGILGAIGVAWQFTRPIQTLQESFRRVQQGDLDVELEPERNDEIGSLTRSFNRMVSRLRDTRKMEQRLVEAEREAAVGRLAAGVAHEVRNPLNAIQLTMQQMKDRIDSGGDPERARKIDGYMETVTSEIARLERLVGSFLDLSRTGTITREEIDLGRSLAAAVELFGPQAASNGVALTLDAGDGLRFRGDPVRLATVWNNLVSNALFAAPAGGRVTVSARREGEEIMVTVNDTGPGIPEEKLAAIWEPFYSGRPGGAGLGLSIVRAVVERHGGSASVRSAPGDGTTFTIRLPLDPPTEQRA